MSLAKNPSASPKACARVVSRATKTTGAAILSLPRCFSMSATARASKPSGAPDRSSRPGALAIRFRSFCWDRVGS